jgi:hypothetical protein
MPAKLNIPLPSKGLVVDRPAEYVDSRSAFNIKNMELDRNVIKKRLGTSALGATLSERILRYFELEIGNQTRLIRVGLTKVQAYTKATDTWANIHNTLLTGSVSDLVSYAFPLLSGTKIACFTNGVNAIRKISMAGNDADLGGTPPVAKFMQAYGPYLVLAYITTGGNTFYSRVQWCDTGLPETWSGGNANSVDLLEDPEDITGLGLFSRFLTVHKNNSIYLGQLITTSGVFSFDRKSTEVGAITGAAIENIPSGEQIFMATDGIHLFNGITAPLIESPIQEEIREELNPAQLHKASAIFVEDLDEVWFSVATGSDDEPQTIYKYNWRTRQIYKDERSNLTTMGLYLNTTEDTWDQRTIAWNSDTTRWNTKINGSLNSVPILGDSTGISTRRTANSNNDNGVAVESIWETKDFTAEDFEIPDIDVIMRWTGLEIWAKGNSVRVDYSSDNGTTWTTISTVTLSSSYPTDASPIQLYFDKKSSQMRFRFFNNTSAESFHLKKYQIEAVRSGSRK